MRAWDGLTESSAVAAVRNTPTKLGSFVCRTESASIARQTDGLRLEGKDTMATATATDRKGPMSTEHKQEREGEGLYIMLLSVGSL